MREKIDMAATDCGSCLQMRNKLPLPETCTTPEPSIFSSYLSRCKAAASAASDGMGVSMKAIILAGGYGTRLHPISLALPKPMAALMDKPLLEHIILLLKKNGLTDICMTLRYLPKVVTDYFQDGGSFGVHITAHIESTPLGTAGGIKDCKDFLAGDDFLVISGDAACDMDLKKLIDFHVQKDADVTIALSKTKKPLEYGLVMTGDGGRVEQFIEKPSRDRVYTDHVNTGIYVLSNRILDEIPDNTPYDFARDLFPKLMMQKRKIFGLLCKGYWCDIGSCLSYLRANFDALSGNLRLQVNETENHNRIWAKSELNKQAVYKPPCYIGEGVKIGNGAVIGPFAVIGSGSSVGKGSLVRGSVLDGAIIDETCRLSGSIVCKGARIGSGTQLMEGSVIGEAAVLGTGCMVPEGVRIWPNKQVPAGTKLKTSLISGMPRTGPMFEVRGIIKGEPGIELTPELCLSMGSAVSGKDVGIAFSGGDYARILAECFSCGVSSSGGQVFRLDAPIAATASFASRLYRLPLTLFAEQSGKTVTLRFFNEKGLPINRETERKLESASVTEILRADSDAAGSLTTITGTVQAHCASASACAMHRAEAEKKAWQKKSIRFSVSGRCLPARLLRSALTGAGFTVCPTGSDLAALELSSDGFSLTVKDENGMVWDHGKLLTALALVEFEHGEGKTVLPYFAPAAADVLAAKLGCRVLRLDRDGTQAEDELLKHPYSSDGLYLALRLASSLFFYKSSFSELMARVPSFFTARREIKLKYDRGRLMRELAGYHDEYSAELVSGLKIKIGKGHAHILPKGGSLLSIKAEGATEEIAEEICVKLEKQVKDILNS